MSPETGMGIGCKDVLLVLLRPGPPNLLGSVLVLIQFAPKRYVFSIPIEPLPHALCGPESGQNLLIYEQETRRAHFTIVDGHLLIIMFGYYLPGTNKRYPQLSSGA